MERRLVGFLVLLFGAAAALTWPELRRYRMDPVRYDQLAGTGVRLDEVTLYPEVREDFAYEGSPLARYLTYERQFVDFDEAAVLAMADQIAEDVGWRMIVAAKVPDIQEAERLLWVWGEEGTSGPAGPGSLPNERARDIMRWIAEGLIQANVYYGEEALFSRSFDTSVERRGDGHVDCDQIAHIFLHVAWRLDLDVREVLSPYHIYLAYVGPADVAGAELAVEPTAFRGRHGRHGSAEGLFDVGPRFFMMSDQLERYGHYRVAPDLQRAAGYFTHATDRDMDDSIASEVLRGITTRDALNTLDAPGDDEVRARWEAMERVLEGAEARLEGTRSPNLVSNLRLDHWRAFRWAMTLGDSERAAHHAARLAAIQSGYAALIIDNERLDEVAAARLLQVEGRAEARAALLSLYQERYGGPHGTSRGFAATDAHAEVLWGLAQLGDGASVADRFSRYLGPVMAYEERARADDRRYAAVAAQCVREVTGVDPALAKSCQEIVDWL